MNNGFAPGRKMLSPGTKGGLGKGESQIEPIAKSKRLTVLLVHGEEVLRRLLVSSIGESKNVKNVLNAGNAHDGIEAFESNVAAVDVVITQVGQDGTGKKVIEHVKNAKPELPVIAVTSGGEDRKQEALAAGADVVLLMSSGASQELALLLNEISETGQLKKE